MVGVQLRALAQPSAQHLRALLDDDVSGQQALVNGPFGLPPQRLGDDGDEVSRVRHAHGVLLPGVAVFGIAEEEQQPGDLDLRPDEHLHRPDPGRADLPGRADQPDPRPVRRRDGGHDAGRSERPPFLRGERQLQRRAELVQLDGAHGSGGAGVEATALRRLSSP